MGFGQGCLTLILVGVVVQLLGIDLLPSAGDDVPADDLRGATVVTQEAKAPMQSSTTAPASKASGVDVCSSLEAFGNKEPGWTQRCVFESRPSAGGRYNLKFGGDYGDDELWVAVAFVQNLEELDRQLGPGGRSIRITFPRGGAISGAPMTVSMAAVRRCLKGSDESSDRLCLVKVMTSAMK